MLENVEKRKSILPEYKFENLKALTDLLEINPDFLPIKGEVHLVYVHPQTDSIIIIMEGAKERQEICYVTKSWGINVQLVPHKLLY